MLINVGTEVINTERLILRRFEEGDIGSVFENWASDEEVQSLYGEPVYSSLDEVRDLVLKYISGYNGASYYRWAIICKDNMKCIGQIAYFLVDSKNHFAEIEYCIGKEYQGRGYGTEATKRIVDFGFNRINLHKVQICHKDLNHKSRRVIEKCGLKYEGTLRDFFFIEGENRYVSRLYYSILKDEFANK